jgi:hypothetical protein
VINIGKHLAAPSIVTRVVEAETFSEFARTLIIFGGANPDRVTGCFARPFAELRS